jgi:hypothetical protein
MMNSGAFAAARLENAQCQPAGAARRVRQLPDAARPGKRSRLCGGRRLTGTFGGTQIELGQVEVLPPRYPATELPGITALAAPVTDFSGLRLHGASALPAEARAGERQPCRLTWERLPGPRSYALVAHLRRRRRHSE